MQFAASHVSLHREHRRLDNPWRDGAGLLIVTWRQHVVLATNSLTTSPADALRRAETTMTFFGIGCLRHSPVGTDETT